MIQSDYELKTTKIRTQFPLNHQLVTKPFPIPKNNICTISYLQINNTPGNQFVLYNLIKNRLTWNYTKLKFENFLSILISEKRNY